MKPLVIVFVKNTNKSYLYISAYRCFSIYLNQVKKIIE